MLPKDARYRQHNGSVGIPPFKDATADGAMGGRREGGQMPCTRNDVIPNCGIDLFDQPFETQTRCILSRVVSR